LASVDAGALTLTVGMTVSPKPGASQALQDLARRYRDALNYAIKVIIENKTLSIGKAHELLYNVLKELFDLPSRTDGGISDHPDYPPEDRCNLE